MKIRFGRFTLDRDTRQLFDGKREIHLSPKGFELLCVLMNRRPAAVSKEELLTRVWPDTFVTEANLPGLVKEIRRALGDDAHDSGFIRTLYGFGYAFSGEATEIPDGVAGRQSSGATFWVVAEAPVQLTRADNVLGRDVQAAVWFDRPGISRHHARIVITGDSATLEDLDSKNGTFLNGERLVEAAALHDGDEIRLGPVKLTFRVRRVDSSTETQAESSG